MSIMIFFLNYDLRLVYNILYNLGAMKKISKNLNTVGIQMKNSVSVNELIIILKKLA